MAQIKLYAVPLREWSPAHFSVALTFGQDGPERMIDVKKVSEIEAALDAFAAELEPQGKPLMLSAMFWKRGGGRKPSGYDKADLRRFVNKEQVARAR